MLPDLEALTPSLIVACAFLIGLLVFLRRQMSPASRPARDGTTDIFPDGGNTDAGGPAPESSPDQPKV
jgi:hypothetical protein